MIINKGKEYIQLHGYHEFGHRGGKKSMEMGGHETEKAGAPAIEGGGVMKRSACDW